MISCWDSSGNKSCSSQLLEAVRELNKAVILKTVEEGSGIKCDTCQKNKIWLLGKWFMRQISWVTYFEECMYWGVDQLVEQIYL